MNSIQEIIQSPPQIKTSREAMIPKLEGLNSSKPISFASTIKDFLAAVNEGQIEAATKTRDLIQGKTQNLADVMTTLEESKLSFQLMLEIRNKLIESYQEIKRMPI